MTVSPFLASSPVPSLRSSYFNPESVVTTLPSFFSFSSPAVTPTATNATRANPARTITGIHLLIDFTGALLCDEGHAGEGTRHTPQIIRMSFRRGATPRDWEKRRS